MRTNVVIAALISFAIAGLLITGSGAGQHTGITDPVGGLDDEVQSQAEESAVGDNGSGVSGTRGGGEDSSIISLVINGAKQIASIVGMVALLPLTLEQIGFPTWFAVPIGTAATLIVSVGLIQFITGRVLR